MDGTERFMSVRRRRIAAQYRAAAKAEYERTLAYRVECLLRLVWKAPRALLRSRLLSTTYLTGF
ncbi:MAG: hypothetical protein Q8P46_06940 [Hyphomicrobiales bacterium]|nr:hypothetical protein [Hyphomicrobiales bacterium]